MNHRREVVTIAEKSPGAQVPIDAIKNPPKTGVMIEVMLSNDELKPRIPPISSFATAFVKALRKTVFKIPLAAAIGIKTIIKEIKLGTTAHKT